MEQINMERNKAILAEIRALAEQLPAGSARRVKNNCDRVEIGLERRHRAFVENPILEPTAQPKHFASQTRQIYAYLMDGHAITSGEGYLKFGTTCLPRRILDIEKTFGICPRRKKIQARNRRGKLVYMNQYWIEPETE